MHGVLAKLGIPVTCTDIFGAWGNTWLDGLDRLDPLCRDPDYAEQPRSVQAAGGGWCENPGIIRQLGGASSLRR